MNKINPAHLLTITNLCKSLLLSALLLTLACAEKDKDENGNVPNADVNLEIETTSDSRGQAGISFLSGEGISKLAVTAITDNDTDIRFTRVSGGPNNYLNPRGVALSLSSEFFKYSSTVSAPSRIADPSISEGMRFDVGVQLRGGRGNLNGKKVTFVITSRKDNNMESGQLPLNIFYVGGVGREQSTKDAVSRALQEARSIFSRAAGISLRIEETEIAGPNIIPQPFEGDALYLRGSESVASPAINVFIGGDIQGGTAGELLGLAAGIPGPPVPSRKSGVAISIFSAAGADGRFDNEDIRLLGETIAHESAHHMGLFHPVDFSGASVTGTDPLADTDECSFFTQCASNDTLIRNLMFPNPVSGPDGNFLPQNNLTTEQRGVVNRYVAVD
ncbi:MAG TPA: hypothetical protein PKA63_02355 [Oligoflexia bacterium]|nr:hypothetical protein [Oligoflexia bacterium]HMP47493.1 hypothetical protein [Oligoflexia bacterium]